MKLPSISVITPSFNQGAFIARTLASVANQSHPPLEHLIFDGGSSDNTLAVLRQAGGSVRWVSRPDGGQADAVNQGLKAARGDVIAWINSDDIYYPQAFAQVAARFAADPSIDVVYGDADHIDLQDQPFEPYPTAVWDPWLLPHVCFICQPACFSEDKCSIRWAFSTRTSAIAWTTSFGCDWQTRAVDLPISPSSWPAPVFTPATKPWPTGQPCITKSQKCC